MKNTFFTIFLAIIFILSTACHREVKRKDPLCSRIISMAPSITETLFWLNLGSKIVGVTRYCNYPEATQSLEKVGGYLDPNLEKIYSLKPSVVFMLKSQENLGIKLRKLGIASITVENDNLEGLLEGIDLIGKHCDADEISKKVISGMKSKLAQYQETLASHDETVMIVVSKGETLSTIRDIYIAGRKSFYNDLLKVTKYKNVYDKNDFAYPKLSLEGILSLNPDVIIDVSLESGSDSEKIKYHLNQWNKFKGLKAVQKGRVHILTEDYIVRPGARFLFIIKKFLEVLQISG